MEPRVCTGTEKHKGCGALKKLNARSLCSFCYQKHQAAGWLEPASTKKGKPSVVADCAACGTPQPVYGKHLCRSCYRRGYEGPDAKCISCEEVKPHFARNACRQCYMRSRQPTFNENRRTRYARMNPQKKAEHSAEVNAYRTRRLYGLNKADVARMTEAQGRACKICRTPFAERGAHVDHCHRTGKVRGLLCGQCNRALGLLQESADVIRAAADYVSYFDNQTL